MDRIARLSYPEVLLPHLESFGSYFPDRVEFDTESKTVSTTEPLPTPIRIATSYLKLVTDIESVFENLELVLCDMATLGVASPYSACEGSRRYFFLTRIFFYELLRIRDAWPRFLKRMEEDGVMTKEERRSSRKLIDEQLEELYLIRNVFLHGHSTPMSDEEFALSLIATVSVRGYAPELRPLDGTPKLDYPPTIRRLAEERLVALTKIASNAVTFCQSMINTTATWVAFHHLGAKTTAAPDDV